MKEKTFRIIYFVVAFLLLILIISQIYSNGISNMRMEKTINQSFEENFEPSSEIKGIEKEWELEFYKSDVGKELFFKDFESEEEYQKAFEDAQAIFRETDVAKGLEKEYQEEYLKLRQKYGQEFQAQWEEYKKSLPAWRRWGGAIALGGLGLLEGGEALFKSIDTPARVALAIIILLVYYHLLNFIYQFIVPKGIKKIKKLN
jgi:hypothetical protein